MANVRIGVKITNSSNCYFGGILGSGVDTVVELDNSDDITIGMVNHSSYTRYSVLYLSIMDIIYNLKNYSGEYTMSNNKDKSCTIIAENSKNIKTGNIHSDAFQVISLQNVENFTTEDIYHFQKDRKKVDTIFETIKQSISMQDLPEGVQAQALALSGSLKEKYLSKDIPGFKDHYREFTDFLSSHVTLFTFVFPVFQSLMTSLLN